MVHVSEAGARAEDTPVSLASHGFNATSSCLPGFNAFSFLLPLIHDSIVSDISFIQMFPTEEMRDKHSICCQKNSNVAWNQVTSPSGWLSFLIHKMGVTAPYHKVSRSDLSQ